MVTSRFAWSVRRAAGERARARRRSSRPSSWPEHTGVRHDYNARRRLLQRCHAGAITSTGSRVAGLDELGRPDRELAVVALDLRAPSR
jgi:hypothetical protein